jgi:hypothetical protein
MGASDAFAAFAVSPTRCVSDAIPLAVVVAIAPASSAGSFRVMIAIASRVNASRPRPRLVPARARICSRASSSQWAIKAPRSVQKAPAKDLKRSHKRRHSFLTEITVSRPGFKSSAWSDEAKPETDRHRSATAASSFKLQYNVRAALRGSFEQKGRVARRGAGGGKYRS